MCDQIKQLGNEQWCFGCTYLMLWRKMLFHSLSLKMKITETASKGCFKDLMS